MNVIRKVGGIVLSRDETRMLVVRKKGRSTFIMPGGRPEGTETEYETLRRELLEETSLTVVRAEYFGRYTEPAAFEPDSELQMSVYRAEVTGELRVDNEIVESLWLDYRADLAGVDLGSTITNHIIPMLMSGGSNAAK